LAVHAKATSLVVVLIAIAGSLGAVGAAHYQERVALEANRRSFDGEAGKIAQAFAYSVDDALKVAGRQLDILAKELRAHARDGRAVTLPSTVSTESMAYLGAWTAEGKLLAGSPGAPDLMPESARTVVGDQLIFARPFRPEDSKDTVLPLWRGAGDPWGGLWGYMGVGLLPGNLMDFFGDLATGKVGDIMLLDTRQRLVVVRSLAGGTREWARELPSPEAWQEFEANHHGMVDQVSPDGGAPRRYAYYPVAGSSLVVAVGTNPAVMAAELDPVIHDIRLRAMVEVLAFLSGAVLLLGLLRSLAHLHHSLEQNQQFLARISHELRTPLNAVIGFSDLMASETFGSLGHGEYRSYARHIYDDGKNLLRLMDGVLNSTGGPSVSPLWMVTMPIAPLVEEALAAIAARAAQQDVGFDLRCPPDHAVWADPAALREVLDALFAAALDRAGPGALLAVEIGEDAQSGRSLLAVTVEGSTRAEALFLPRRIIDLVEAHGGQLVLAPHGFRAVADLPCRHMVSLTKSSESLA
jgi:signal transduction histidine kinase